MSTLHRLHVVREGPERGQQGPCILRHVEPSEPFRLGAARPEPGIPGPEAADAALAGPLGQRGLVGLAERRGQVDRPVAAEPEPERREPLGRDRGKEAVERLGEERHGLRQELVRHRVEVDAGRDELMQHGAGALGVLLQRGAGRAVVPEGRERGGGHGVHRARARQLLHVEHVRQRGVFCARAGPQEPLRPRARGLQRLPAGAREDLAKDRVRHLGVGDRHLVPQPRRRAACRVEPRVHRHVDPADEEARDAGDAARVAALADQRLQPADVGLCHVAIRLVGEQQSDVDGDAFADQRLDRGDALGRRGDLHHQVGTVHRRPEAPRLLQRALGVAGEVGGDLQADVAVHGPRRVVDGPKDVGRRADVRHGQGLVEVPGLAVALLQHLRYGLVVVRARADGLLEDGWVRG